MSCWFNQLLVEGLLPTGVLEACKDPVFTPNFTPMFTQSTQLEPGALTS